MKNDRSCGCIIINDNNEVLLVYEKRRKYWGFPKGHKEGNESEEETAIREVKEEVDLDVIIDSNHKYEISYSFGKINKSVIYFIAKPINTDITIQESEIKEYKWCSYEEAKSLINYDNLREILIKAINEKSV